MCFKGNTQRSQRRDRHQNARPYVREKNLTYNIMKSEDYVSNLNEKGKGNNN